MRFPGFAGNADARRTLSGWTDAGRLPHAVLLEGPAGAGRRTLARILARAAVCRGGDDADKPCGVCAACVKAAHPDIAELGGDGGYQSVHIDVIRALREDAYILPNESARRAVILSGAEGMTAQAQNALLKLLEEPPAHLMLILTCENRGGLLPTILSRVQTVRLAGVTEAEAAAVLRERLPGVEEGLLREAARVYDGVIGQALEALGGDAGENAGELFRRIGRVCGEMAEALASGREWALMTACGALEKDKPLTDGVLAALRLTLRDALAYQALGDAGGGPASPEVRALAASASPERLLAWVRVLEELQAARRRNAHQGLLLTLLHSRMLG